MFFYLIQNSTLLKKEIDENKRVTKIFLYGGTSYIVLHATLFMGGKDSLLNSLKKYFWMFFILDLSTMFLTNNSDINLNDLVNKFVKNLTSKQPKKSSLKNNNMKKFEKKVEKKVHFSDDKENEYSSDSESDIGTDIDFEEFKKSLSL